MNESSESGKEGADGGPLSLRLLPAVGCRFAASAIVHWAEELSSYYFGAVSLNAGTLSLISLARISIGPGLSEDSLLASLPVAVSNFLSIPNTFSDMQAVASGRWCATTYSRPPISSRESGRTIPMVLLPGLLLAYNWGISSICWKLSLDQPKQVTWTWAKMALATLEFQDSYKWKSLGFYRFHRSEHLGLRKPQQETTLTATSQRSSFAFAFLVQQKLPKSRFFFVCNCFCEDGIDHLRQISHTATTNNNHDVQNHFEMMLSSKVVH